MFLPITDEDVPRIVALMNRAYRGAGAAGWSTEEPYLSGDRINEIICAPICLRSLRLRS
jgi:hypothetical protein